MSIQIKISKKIEEIEENHPIEYYEIHAETSHIQKQITFTINGNHLATTMTDDQGNISAGTSLEPNKKYVFGVECEDETETVEFIFEEK